MVTSFIQLNRRDAGDGECDWHGVVNEIFKLEYPNKPLKRIVLFNCEWYDPIRPRGKCKHNHYKIIEICNIPRHSASD